MSTQSIASLFNITAPSPIQRVNVEWTQFSNQQTNHTLPNKCDNTHQQVELWCKRDDLLHPIISGNKWRKLVKPLTNFRRTPPKHVLSFGGPYSNHLHALAYCCKHLNIKFTALVRGAYLSAQTLNPTLNDLKIWGANIIYLDKEIYKRRNEAAYLDELKRQLDADTIIPEGGSQLDALSGMRDLLNEITLNRDNSQFDAIVLPVASGASMAGVIEACEHPTANQVLGIGVLKGEEYLESLVTQFLNKSGRTRAYLPWRIEHNFHFGAYAKTTPQLDTFCNTFNQQQSTLHKLQPLANDKIDTPLRSDKIDTPLSIEPVYSGKCFYAVKSLIQQGYFPPGSRILVIHTGGLQGSRASKAIIT